MTIIRLVAGDWSGDGHDKTDFKDIEANCTANEFAQAIRDGIALMDFETKHNPGDQYHTLEQMYPNLAYLPFCEEYEDATVKNQVDAARFHLKASPDGVGGWVDATEVTQEQLDTEDMFVQINLDDEPVENDWYNMHIKLAMIGRPGLTVTSVTEPQTVIIGGYGLFY